MGIIFLTEKFKPCAQSNNGSALIFRFPKQTHLCTKNHYCLTKTSHYNSFLGLNLFLNLLHLHLQPPFLGLRMKFLIKVSTPTHDTCLRHLQFLQGLHWLQYLWGPGVKISINRQRFFFQFVQEGVLTVCYCSVTKRWDSSIAEA